MSSLLEDRSAAALHGGVQVIARVGQIFRALEGEPWGLTMSQLAVRLDLPRSTIHRLVNALASEGLLMNASVAGRVCIGSEFVRIATASRSELRDKVEPLMRRVNEAVGETVDCSILEGDMVRVIDVIETQHQLRAVSNIGATFPLYCTAKGKAILAELDNATIMRLIPEDFEPFTGFTVHSRAQLMKEIEEVRSTGLAFNREEHSIGICTIAIASKDPFGTAFTISVPIPTLRYELLKGEIEIALLEILAELKAEFAAG